MMNSILQTFLLKVISKIYSSYQKFCMIIVSRYKLVREHRSNANEILLKRTK